MKTIVTEAIILRRVNYGEADRIVTVLSNELGKVPVMARAVRKLKSKLAGGLELLSVNEMTLIEGKGDMYVLRSARMKQQLSDGILESYERSEQAFAGLKQINILVEETEGAEFYELLAEYLKALNDGLELGLAETWWSLRLLAQLGHTPNLTTDSEGKPLDENAHYLFNPDEGTFGRTTSHQGDVFTSDHIKLWRLALHLEPMSLANIKNCKVLAEIGIQSLRLLTANHTS